MHTLNVTCKVAKNTDEIKSVIREVDAWYDAHRESEGWGYCDYYDIGATRQTGKNFESEREASEWAYNYAMEHEVTAVCTFTFPRSSKYIQLEKKLDETKKKLSTYREAHSVKKFKSATVGCETCKSKLSIKWLKSEECPVCGDDLRSKTTLETIGRYEKQIRDLEKELKAEERAMIGQKTMRKNDATYYMVAVFVDSHN